MKLPFSWIKECLATDLSPVAVSDVLTMLGLEVEGIETPQHTFSGVVVGKVLNTEKHPDADKLCVATVTDGTETLQVVCGAANCRPGLVTALAPIGASLTGPDGKAFKIKKGKLRGVESFGMLCAADELGLPGSQEGIMELPETLPLGGDLAQLCCDAVFDIALTPNLGHCASLQGVLRELSAALDTSYALPEVYIDDQSGQDITAEVGVVVQDATSCPRYACRLVKNVKVGPSPQWMQDRLIQCGMRPVNNIVDCTNYVLLELGHPLHAFDYQKVVDHQIIVRTAAEGETFVTLDGVSRQLPAGAVLICDADKPIALAGIMGGQCSEVDDHTQHVLIESAYFQPTSIRRTSKKLGLTTEASKRFERAVDPNGVLIALDRVAFLIQEICGGEIAKGVIDVRQGDFSEKKITCRLSRIHAIVGQHLTVSDVEGVFRRLNFAFNWDSHDQIVVRVPTYRADVHAEIDLVEEVVRIFGYDHIDKQPAYYRSSDLPHAPIFLFERQARQKLLGLGLQEFVTCDLIGPTALSVLQPDVTDDPSEVRVLNPTSAEQSILRQSLLPGLLQAVKYNIDRKNQNIAVFEIGRSHLREGDQFKEQSVLGIVLTGKARPHHWEQHPGPFDFYELKGIIEDLLEGLGIPSASFEAGKLLTLHPGRQSNILIGDVNVGAIGEVHPDVLRRLDVPQRILFGEINLHDLYRLRSAPPQMQELPQFPGSERDWTVTVRESMPVSTLVDLINQYAPTLLEEVSVLDVYRSEKIGTGVKNVTFRFFYRDRTKTVQQEEVDAKHQRLIKDVIQQMEGQLKASGSHSR